MVKHKLDVRQAYKEGDFAEYLYDLTNKYYGISLTSATVEQDCSGIDRIKDKKEIDIKSRKGRKPPHMVWIELSAAEKNIGTGWAYKDKYTAQMMVYENNKFVNDVIFGEFYNPDLVENVLKNKVDFDSRVSVQTLYKVYTRISYGKHRGDMTLVNYEDLESLESFKRFDVPREYWQLVVDFYEYKGIL